MYIELYRKKWHIRWPKSADRPNGKRVSLRTADRAIAEQRFEQYKRELARAPETITEIMDRYLEEKKNLASIDSQRYAWKALRSIFGNLRPSDLTLEHSERYKMMRRKDGIKDGTIHRDIGVLRAAIAHAGQTAITSRPRGGAVRERWITKGQFRFLMAECKQTPHLEVFVGLCIGTGGRPKHVLQLTWARYNEPMRQIDLGMSVGNKRRARVPVNRSLECLLQRAREVATCDHIVEYNGAPIKEIGLSWGKAILRANNAIRQEIALRQGDPTHQAEPLSIIEKCGPGILRHSAAVWMVQARTPIEEVSKFLGHTDVKITMKHYAHFSPDHLRAGAAALEW